jgi:molybdopterin/thiamine biosynthesis adenylyltransferase
MTQDEISEIEINAPERVLRFKGADFYTPGAQVLLLGAGGIGSHVGFLLAKQDCILHMYDMDTVEEHNLGGQLYQTRHLGQPKVVALLDTIANVIGAENTSSFTIRTTPYEENSLEDSFVFSCFDNMAARKLAFEKWKNVEDPNKIFIDGRMLADQGVVYCVVPGREAAYEATLFDDSEVDEGPCSNRATSFGAFFTSALMVANFNNHLANIKHGMSIKTVCFKTRYALSLGLIEVQDEPELAPIQTEALSERASSN